MEDPVGRDSPVHEYVKVDTGARRRREECCRLRDQRIDLGAVERNAAGGADFERDNRRESHVDRRDPGTIGGREHHGQVDGVSRRLGEICRAQDTRDVHEIGSLSAKGRPQKKQATCRRTNAKNCGLVRSLADIHSLPQTRSAHFRECGTATMARHMHWPAASR